MSTEKDKIIFMQTFPTGQFANQKLGVEMYVDYDFESMEQAFKRAKELVEETFIKLNPQINWSRHEEPVLKGYHEQQQESKDSRIQSFIATINMCASLKFLRNFGARVREENNELLTIAYQEKEHELMLKETKESV